MTTEMDKQELIVDEPTEIIDAPEPDDHEPDQDKGERSSSPYVSLDDGLYKVEGSSQTKVCSPLKITARTRNNDGTKWGAIIELQDLDNNWKELIIPNSKITGTGAELVALLVDRGLRLANQKPKTKQDLLDYLALEDIDVRALCVDRPGWHDNVFVTPYDVFNGTGKKLIERVVLQGAEFQSNIAKTGTLKDWNAEVGKYLSGNSRLLLAVGASLAAPLLHLLDIPESGGFHFHGGSSIGKTTALIVGGSVWGGGPNGYIHSWHATQNGIEAIAEAYCDATLCLDEISQGNAKDVGQTAYMLANGQGKTRSNKSITVDPVKHWRLIFLSTGEDTLSDKIAEAGERVRAGQMARLADVPADVGTGYGIFDTLHDFRGPGQLADHLKEAARNHHGTLAAAYLAKLTEDMSSDKASLMTLLEDEMDSFIELLEISESDGQVKRVAKRFALAAAAGELAIRYGLLDQEEGEFLLGVATCFEAWLEHRGTSGAIEDDQILSHIRHFIERYQNSRFESSLVPDPSIKDLAGYIKPFDRGPNENQTVFAFLPDVFKAEVCKGFSYKRCVETLKKNDLIVLDGDGRADKRVRIYGTPIRCICILDKILYEDTSNADAEEGISSISAISDF